MKLNTILRNSCFAVAITTIGILGACQPDEVEGGNALFASDMDASFSVSPTDNSGNRYAATASDDGAILLHTWRYTSSEGDDSGEMQGPGEMEFFFPDAGTYTITHRAAGSGGTSTISEQTVVVTTPDPVAGNLIAGGKFTAGQGPWQILNISPSGAAWTFADGVATINGTGSNQQGIYQAIQVVGGVDYRFDMKVSGPGSTNTWFEVFISPQAPVQNSDYSAGGAVFALNTWAGCATGPFSGLISVVGCANHSGNPVSFTESGTVYVVIKSGGENINNIVVDNVELRRIVD